MHHSSVPNSELQPDTGKNPASNTPALRTNPYLASLAGLAEHLPDALLIVDLAGTVCYANPAYLTLTGYPVLPDDAPLRELLTAPPAEQLVAQVQQQRTWQGACVYRCHNAATPSAHLTAALLHTSDGTPLAIATVLHAAERERAVEALRDAHSTLARRVQERNQTVQRTSALLQAKIEELRQIQTNLRSSETRQRTLLHAIPDALIVCNRGGTILDAHLPADYAALHPQPLVGQHIHMLIPEPDSTRITHLIQQVLYTGAIHTHEYRRQHGTTHRHYQARIVPAQIDSVLMLIHEITEQRAVENDLAQFFRLSPDLMLVVGENATIKHCNGAWECVLGYPAADLIGRRTLDFIHPDDDATARQYAERLHAGELVDGIETRYRHRDGSYRWLRWRAVRDPATTLIHAIAQDITAERTAQQVQSLLHLVVDDSPNAVLILRSDTAHVTCDSLYVQYANAAFVHMVGLPAPLPPQQPIAAFNDLWGTTFAQQLVQCAVQGTPARGSVLLHTPLRAYHAAWHCTVQQEPLDGAHYLLLELHPFNAAHTTHRLATAQLQVLEAIVQGEPLDAVLGLIATMIEDHIPTARTVLQVIVDGKVVRRAAPRIPPAYSAEIRAHYPQLYLDVAQQPQPGTPCASALATGRTILVDDIAASSDWPRWREIAQRYGLQSCWTAPIAHVDSHPAGVIVVYGTNTSMPDEQELALLKIARHLASLAVERLYLNDQLQYQSLHDALTGLPNREGFENAVERALAELPSTAQQMVLGIINLDRFKHINTGLGHEVGDLLIRMVAQRLRGLVEPIGMLARLSGDEFGLLLPQGPSLATAHELAESLLDALRVPFVVDDFELIITASIGLSCAPTDATTTSGLLQCADWAMTRAKADGANQVMAFIPGMSTFARERLQLEQQLHLALNNHELLLFFQPQWDIQRGKLYGVEALIRWQHPLHGLLEAGKFLPLAEAGGLTFAIGSWVLQAACRQAAAWYRAGTPLRMSVNISAAQLMHPDFITSLQATLAHYQLPADLLELELIEGTALQDHATGAQRLHDVRALGIRIAIDDFGTGYSSLAYLQRFRVDTLKIDRSFVAALDRNDVRVAISDSVPLVQTIISLAHNFRLTVVAEGVETAHQLTFLQHAGCEVVQGFLLGRPVPVEQIERMLHQPPPLLLPNQTSNGAAHP